MTGNKLVRYLRFIGAGVRSQWKPITLGVFGGVWIVAGINAVTFGIRHNMLWPGLVWIGSTAVGVAVGISWHAFERDEKRRAEEVIAKLATDERIKHDDLMDASYYGLVQAKIARARAMWPTAGVVAIPPSPKTDSELLKKLMKR